ncbi:hypothetical protein [Azospirillum sp. ST 5-10]|uniref:hypothetical protein n=1 Tax=unclassified Azospirillum TaxID=2630922 RepID=UPI003F4A2DD8
MPRKVAIIGRSAATRGLAPWHDPAWEVWALAWDVPPRADRYFEMHATPSAEGYGSDPVAFLAASPCPVYMRAAHPAIPCSVAYPLLDVIGVCGREFHSSIAYMVGLAVAEGVDVLGLWGVDAVDGYAYQHANLRWLLGIAKGRGVSLRFPDGCALAPDGRQYGAPEWEGP